MESALPRATGYRQRHRACVTMDVTMKGRRESGGKREERCAYEVKDGTIRNGANFYVARAGGARRTAFVPRRQLCFYNNHPHKGIGLGCPIVWGRLNIRRFYVRRLSCINPDFPQGAGAADRRIKNRGVIAVQ